MINNQQPQKHPQEHRDRLIVNRLIQEGSTDYNLAELARLLIRYKNFPGANEIQKDLQTILSNWDLTEETLYTKTRLIHAAGLAYRKDRQNKDQQDWS